MAPKRPPPIEEPPSASETSEEEELDDASEEEPPTPVQSSLKNSNPKSNPNPASVPKYKPSSDDSDGSDSDDSDAENGNPPQDFDSDSEEASDSDNEPVNHMIIHRSADAKPISSKPMMPPATPSAAAVALAPAPSKPSSSAAKRPLDGGDTEKNDKKTKKKKVSEIGDKGDHNNNNNNKDDSEKKPKSGDDKKVPFQRIWSDEDEIVILNGLIDFKKKGYNVSTQLGAFFDFIKDSLHVVPNKNQLNNKVQRLKNKYQNNANRAKPGENPVISRPHEFLSYNLSKEIWGEQSGKDDGPDANHVGTESSGKPDVKKTKTSLSANTIASPRQKISNASPKQKVSIVPDGKSPQVETKEEDSPSGSAEYHYLNQSLRFRNDPSMLVPPLDLGEIVAKKGWDSAKCLDATSLNKRWKNVMIAETKAYLARIDLVREQTKLMLDELESSGS